MTGALRRDLNHRFGRGLRPVGGGERVPHVGPRVVRVKIDPVCVQPGGTTTKVKAIHADEPIRTRHDLSHHGDLEGRKILK